MIDIEKLARQAQLCERVSGFEGPREYWVAGDAALARFAVLVLEESTAICQKVENSLKTSGLREQSFGAGDCVANINLQIHGLRHKW
jgi:hypothetical protein